MKGKIILTCGHEDHNFPHGIPLRTKDWDCDWIEGLCPVISYGSVCSECFIKALREYPEEIFVDEYAADEWMREEMRKTREGRRATDLAEAEMLEQKTKELRSKYG